jgi:hypothetical protein
MDKIDLMTFKRNQEILDKVIREYYEKCLRHSDDYEDYIGWTWSTDSEIAIHYIQLDYHDEWINEEYYTGLDCIVQFAKENGFEFEPMGNFNFDYTRTYEQIL